LNPLTYKSPDERTAPAAAAVSPLRSLKARLLQADRPLFALFQSVGTQALITAINVLTGVMTARMLGADGRGIYTAVSTWPQLFATLAVAGLNSAVVYRLRKSPEHRVGITGAAVVLCLASALICAAVGVLLLPFLMDRYTPDIVLFSQICLVSVMVNSLQMLIKQTFAGMGEFARCNLANLLPQALYLFALLAVVIVVPVTARNAVLALLGSGAIALLAALPGFIRLARPGFKAAMQELPQLASYSSRAWLMDVVFTTATYMDRLVLIPMLSPEQLGFYGVAFSFSRVILLSQPAILSVMLSHMSGRAALERRRMHDHALRFLVAALLVGCALLWMVGEPLLTFTYGAEFAAASTLFRLLVIEASLAVLSQVTAQLFLSDDRPGVVSIIQVVVLGVSIALLLVLVPLYGAVGAALGLMAAGLIRWMLFLAATRLILRFPLPRLYLVRDDFRYILGLLR
jgi:enterobacterial common antigen flippase